MRSFQKWIDMTLCGLCVLLGCCSGFHLVLEVWRGGGQDAAVGFEHMSLDADGEVTEPAVLSLPVQTVQHRGLSTGEAHLDHRARCVTGGWAAAAASHFHGQGLHLGSRRTLIILFSCFHYGIPSLFVFGKLLQGVKLKMGHNKAEDRVVASKYSTFPFLLRYGKLRDSKQIISKQPGNQEPISVLKNENLCKNLESPVVENYSLAVTTYGTIHHVYITWTSCSVHVGVFECVR